MHNKSGQMITTERLYLREAHAGDAEFYLRLVNSEGWLCYIGDRKVKDEQSALLYLQSKVIPSYGVHGYGMYTVELRSTGQSIGVCGLVNRDTLPMPDLGFALLPEFEGQGFAYEAAQATLDFARATHKLASVLAITLQDNRRSIQLLERLDFILEPDLTKRAEDKNLMHYIIPL